MLVMVYPPPWAGTGDTHRCTLCLHPLYSISQVYGAGYLAYRGVEGRARGGLNVDAHVFSSGCMLLSDPPDNGPVKVVSSKAGISAGG